MLCLLYGHSGAASAWPVRRNNEPLDLTSKGADATSYKGAFKGREVQMVKGILLGAISMAISIVLAHLGVRVAEVRRLRLTASAEHRD
jgi:hypothetical protein